MPANHTPKAGALAIQTQLGRLPKHCPPVPPGISNRLNNPQMETAPAKVPLPE